MNPEAVWHFDDKCERDYAFLRDHPAPRPFGVFDQLTHETRSLSNLAVWALVFGTLVFGIIKRDVALLVFPGVAIPFLGVTFLRLMRVRRRGEILVVRAFRIARTWGDSVCLEGSLPAGNSRKQILLQVKNSELMRTLLNGKGLEVLTLVDVERLEDPRAHHQGHAIRPLQDAQGDAEIQK